MKFGWFFLMKNSFTTVKICKTIANVVLIVLKVGSESAVRCTVSFGNRLPVDVVSAKSSFTGVIASKENPFYIIFIISYFKVFNLKGFFSITPFGFLVFSKLTISL